MLYAQQYRVLVFCICSPWIGIGILTSNCTPSKNATGIEDTIPQVQDTDVPTPLNLPPLTTECRPVDHIWDPATEPMRLPCEPTTEPCDGIDNDGDGFLDPHCPTIPCLSDADCTFGGLLPDADCNEHPSISSITGEELPGRVCNQIDGVPGNAALEKCWGKLCPPTLKCVSGDCVPPGTGLPGAVCSSGADCPLHAGCIPKVIEEQGNTGATEGTCKWYCHEFDCPEGIPCEHSQRILPETGDLYETKVCYAGIIENCTPDCTQKKCGDDGCGGECPDLCIGTCDPISNQCIDESSLCTNEAGIAIVDTSTVIPKAMSCAQETPGDTAAIGLCIQKGSDIRFDCAMCYSALIECLFSQCNEPCKAGQTPPCEQCVQTQCGANFLACSGIDLSEGDK